MGCRQGFSRQCGGSELVGVKQSLGRRIGSTRFTLEAVEVRTCSHEDGAGKGNPGGSRSKALRRGRRVVEREIVQWTCSNCKQKQSGTAASQKCVGRTGKALDRGGAKLAC